MFLNFKEIRDRNDIESVANWLNLKLRKESTTLRGQCPHNQGGERELVIQPAKGRFDCYGCKANGSCIDLVAHVKGIDFRAAAQELQALNQKPSQSPKIEPGDAFDPQKVLTRLQYDHEALTVPPEVAKAIGLGVDPRGLHKGRIAIACRNDKGTIVGFISVPVGTDIKVPKDFRSP